LKDAIEALIELQSIDDEIRSFLLTREELAANQNRLTEILDRMNGELDEKRSKLTEAQSFHNERQDDLKLDSERLTKAKAKMAGVTRTKEYAAMQREMDNFRRKYSEDDTELKRLSAAIAEYNSAISSQEEKLAELQGEVKREEATSGDRLSELNREIDAIESRKSGINGRLDDQLLKRYGRVLGKREGKAVVAAIGGKCSGCQMRLPPQLFILVQRAESLQACPACQRFLFFRPPEEV
jgi:predicted  nucleic acid-binding Zn-ribbon protein